MFYDILLSYQCISSYPAPKTIHPLPQPSLAPLSCSLHWKQWHLELTQRYWGPPVRNVLQVLTEHYLCFIPRLAVNYTTHRTEMSPSASVHGQIVLTVVFHTHSDSIVHTTLLVSDAFWIKYFWWVFNQTTESTLLTWTETWLKQADQWASLSPDCLE